MNHPSLPLILFLIVFCSGLFASNISYFDKIMDQVEENIQTESYEKNLLLGERLKEDGAFDSLSCYQKGKIFHKIGVSCYLLDREDEAIDYFQNWVLKNWDNCPEVPPGEKANTIYNIGICYQYLGNATQAKKHLDESLYIFESDPNYPSLSLAKKYSGVANFYMDNYDAFRAELYYENALNVLSGLEDTELMQFDILNNLLILCLDFKRFEKAQSIFNQALSFLEQFPESISEYERSMLYQNVGIYYFELGQLEAASDYTYRGLGLIDSLEDPDLYSDAIEKLAMIKAETGERDEAISMLKEVVKKRKALLSTVEDYQTLSYAYENLCEVHEEKGDLNTAHEFLQKAFDILLIKGRYDADGLPVVGQSLIIDDLDMVRLLSIKARLYNADFDRNPQKPLLEKSLLLYSKIDTLISKNILLFQFEDSKLNFLELIQSYYGKGIQIALKLKEHTGDSKYLQLAYNFSAKTKGIILRNELNRTEAFESFASNSMIEKEQALVNQMYDLQERLAAEDTDQDTLLRDYIEIQRELDQFLTNLENDAPEYFQNKFVFIAPVQVDAIQSSLPADMALVEYFFTPEEIISFWITKDQFFQVPIPNQKEFMNQISDYVNQCHDPNIDFSVQLGSQIYQKLLKTGLSKLKPSIDRLSIIPDGLLHTLPFEALNTQNDKTAYLVEDFSISYAYSANLLFRKKEHSFELPYLGFSSGYSSDLSQKLKNKQLLFGNENLPQLVLARQEIDRSTNLFSGRMFLDREATLDNFYQYASKAAIIHLSLHGLVDFDDPLRSSIIFDDHQEEFVLSAADLYTRKIHSELVVLSACHSANGKVYLSEGVQGMSKAFLLSGAQTILSSLWSASEASSLQIIPTFLDNFKQGLTKDQALHQAKLNYLSSARPSQKHPSYWANFVLIGEITPDTTSNFPLLLLLAGLSLLAAVVLLIYFNYRYQFFRKLNFIPLSTLLLLKSNK